GVATTGSVDASASIRGGAIGAVDGQLGRGATGGAAGQGGGAGTGVTRVSSGAGDQIVRSGSGALGRSSAFAPGSAARSGSGGKLIAGSSSSSVPHGTGARVSGCFGPGEDSVRAADLL